MKKLTLMLFFAANLLSAKPLIIGIDGGYPPLSEINPDGTISGFDPDMAAAICKEIKAECTVKQVDWEALIPALQTKQIDIIFASMNVLEERKKKVLFSEPYYHNPGIFIRRKNSNIELNEQDLKNKTIGVLAASVFEKYAKEKYGKIAKIASYPNQNDANLDAIKGVVDIMFGDKIVLQQGFLDTANGKDFEQFAGEISDAKYIGEGIAIAMRLNEKELCEKINKAIKTLRENGEYKKINDKYFPYDVSQ
ncbi:MAG: transporter substrate-binding domain-containing protein [Cardiobacteriaceae bacterium]|nr:transporter substrate-binding domain-containing protein [Cardiobacteriaceae bacterium]